MRPPPPTDTPAAPSPGRAKRKLAKDELGELGTAYMAWSDINAEAEKELRMSFKLYEAKMRRIDQAQAGKRHGCPFLELDLERIYKQGGAGAHPGQGEARRGRGVR